MKFSAQRRRFVAASLAGTLAMGLAVSAGPVASADPVADPAGRTVTLTGDRHQGLPGQYESTYSAKTNRLYVSAVSWADKAEDGTLVNGAATIAEVDPVTLKVTHAAPVPVEADDAKSSAYYGLESAYEPVSPFGIAADDTRNLVWSTDTVNGTVSAYDQTTLKQVWRSPAGSLPHGREVSVMANGDVIVSGNGGLWRVTGHRDSLSIAPYALNGKGEATIPMSMAQAGGEVFVNDVRMSEVRVLDEATGALKRSFTMAKESSAVSHGHLGVDAGLGVVVAVDQGARDKATGAYTGSGVTLYKTDGTVLGRTAVGAHNLPLAIDKKNHIAYVGDWGGNGEVRAFDLQSAAAGKPAVIGQVATTTPATGAAGVNYLTMVGSKVFAVNKDEVYTDVTVPYGVDLKTGNRVAVKGNADSMVLLDTAVKAKTFDPATDSTRSGGTDGYDLSNLSLEPLPAGPLGFGSSFGSGSLGGPAAPAGSESGIPTGSLGSLADLVK